MSPVHLPCNVWNQPECPPSLFCTRTTGLPSLHCFISAFSFSFVQNFGRLCATSSKAMTNADAIVLLRPLLHYWPKFCATLIDSAQIEQPHRNTYFTRLASRCRLPLLRPCSHSCDRLGLQLQKKIVFFFSVINLFWSTEKYICGIFCFFCRSKIIFCDGQYLEQ